MIMVSMIHWLTGWHIDCTTNASLPRTDSWYRTKISPLANWYASVGVGATPRYSPISSASSGKALPEKSMRLFLFSPVMLAMDQSLRRVLLACSIARLRWRGIFPSGPGGRLGGRRTRTAPLHPALEHALLSGRHGEGTGRYVVAHDRTGSGVRAVAHLHR